VRRTADRPMDVKNWPEWPDEWAPQPNISISTAQTYDTCPRGWLLGHLNSELPLPRSVPWRTKVQLLSLIHI